ncbi:hypothetical protein C0995_016011 [Termitomyces sp. Mi166|nr:hypothetical protein C0995_016011 [Termitomyces sp. Mi166\
MLTALSFAAAPDLPVFIIKVVSPTFVLLSTLSLLFIHPPVSVSPSPITSVVVATNVPRRAFILTFLSLTSFTFFLDGLTFTVQTVINKYWPRHSGTEINSFVGLVAFAGLAVIGSWKDIQGVHVWTLTRIKLSVLAALLLDLALATLLGLRIRVSRNDDPHIPEIPRSSIPIVPLLYFIFPVLRVLLLVPLLGALLTPRTVYTTLPTDEDIEVPTPTASSFLLPPGVNPQSSQLSALQNDSTKYGTFQTVRSNLQRSVPATRAATPAPSTGPDSKADTKPEISLDPSWSEIWRRIRRLDPYLWPTKNSYLQLLASLCIIILLLGRVINVAMPLALGKLVSLLEKPTGQSPWPFFFAYIGLRFLQGSGGLAAVRDALWAPVMQYSDREMSQLSFDHLLNLSFAWHTRRKTGEILRVLDRGAAINHTLELILFNIIPTFIDIVVALIAFAVLFQWTLAAVIFVVMFAYVAASVILTRWRTRIRRKMNERDIVTRGIHTDCLLNYETVKYFGGEEHEGERYRDALREYQALEYKVIVDTEKLLVLLNEPTEVNDKPNAPDLIVNDGEIEFENVSFSYDGRTTALNGISFKVPKGGSVALVGESGSGNNVTQKSLRQAIGVVPQDSVLFNASISYNIGYGKFGASPDEIEAAAKSAQMHDRIMSFSEGYETKVGERGVRLSGGEKQRVAIARTLLKNPPILLLDEATRQELVLRAVSPFSLIRKALQNLVKGRSSLSIAHRLSTIASADLIVVLKDGQIVERGSHKELLALDGIFASMWADQVSASDDRTSLDERSIKKEVSGYVGESEAQVEHEATPVQLQRPEVIPSVDALVDMPTDVSPTAEAVLVDLSGYPTPTAELVASQRGESIKHEELAPSSPPIHSPIPITPITAPLAFPTTNELEQEPPESQLQPQSPPTEGVSTPQVPAVSFPAHLTTPPSRTGTPDTDSEPKRKRISSQNFQRLARKISLTTRRQSSSSIIPGISSIPGLKRESPRVSTDDSSQRAESSQRNESPAGSIKDGEAKTKLKKKDKKEKNRKSTM